MRSRAEGSRLEGVRIADKRLAPLLPVLKEWLRIIPQYARRTRNALGEADYPYWYTERATLGSLAAAAWLAGGVAIEEYSARKGRRNSYIGRADLWILVRGEGFAIEAKQRWLSIGKRGRTPLSLNVSKWLDQARREVRALTHDPGCHVGAVFVVPYLPEDERDQIEPRVRELIEDARRLPFDGAWWLDPSVQLADDQDLYPGVLLIVGRV